MQAPSPDQLARVHEALASEDKNHVRRTWLRHRVLSTLDTERGGGYRWDPDEYMPIPVEQDGEDGFAFAKVRP